MQLIRTSRNGLCIGLLICLVILCNAALSEDYAGGQVRTVMRGNSLDIHFINLSPLKVKIEPFFYDNSTEVQDEKNRNLVFIPNTGHQSPHACLPISLTLPEAGVISYDGKSRLAARRFIQSIVVCNNISSYKKKDDNYDYNNDGEYAPYSAFMWTNGVRSPDDGAYVFSNAMKDLNNLKYFVTMYLSDSKSIMFTLNFSTISHFKDKQVLDADTAYMKRLSNVNDIADHIAALTSLAAGILSIPTNPAGGVLATVSGAAWEVQASAQTMLDNVIIDSGYKGEITGYSWLSSPFDIILNISDYYIKDSENNIIGRGEFDKERGVILFYLGNDSSPSGIILQLSSSSKGDLYVNLLSLSLMSRDASEKIPALSEFSEFQEGAAR